MTKDSWSEPDLHEKQEVECPGFVPTFMYAKKSLTHSYISRTSYLIGSCTCFRQPQMKCSDLIGLQIFLQQNKMGIGLQPNFPFFVEVVGLRQTNDKEWGSLHSPQLSGKGHQLLDLEQSIEHAH